MPLTNLAPFRFYLRTWTNPSSLVSFIWGIADDVLLPLIVVRRLDAVLEPTKQAVLDMKAKLLLYTWKLLLYTW